MSDYLPPGVSNSDLPGSRPIDNYFEQVFEILSKKHPDFVDAVEDSNDLLEEAGTYISDAFHTEKTPFSGAVAVFNGLKDKVRNG